MNIPTYSTVNQFCERHRAFTLGGIRSNIFNEKSNGLAKSGAIVRNGRRVLINEEKFFEWLEAQNQNGDL
jgi:phage tail protein X